MPARVKAITFDAAGTLIRVAEPVGKTYAERARNHGIEARADALEKAFRRAFGRAPSPYAAAGAAPAGGTGDRIEYHWWKELVRETFAGAMPDADETVSDSLFDPLFEDLFEHYARAEAWRLIPGVRKILEFLTGRVPLGIVSNFDSRFLAIARGLDLSHYFENVILSASVSAWKPDPAIYTAAASGLGFPPANILHAGDDPACDWEGARRAGFQVFEFDPETAPLDRILAFLD